MSMLKIQESQTNIYICMYQIISKSVNSLRHVANDRDVLYTVSNQCSLTSINYQKYIPAAIFESGNIIFSVFDNVSAVLSDRLLSVIISHNIASALIVCMSSGFNFSTQKDVMERLLCLNFTNSWCCLLSICLLQS